MPVCPVEDKNAVSVMVLEALTGSVEDEDV
jgi:hypothetical protein